MASGARSIVRSQPTATRLAALMMVADVLPLMLRLPPTLANFNCRRSSHAVNRHPAVDQYFER